MLSLITWALYGGKWRVYAIAVPIFLILLYTAYRIWRAKIENDARKEMAARNTLRRLENMKKAISVDEELLYMSPSAARERLRQWADR